MSSNCKALSLPFAEFAHPSPTLSKHEKAAERRAAKALSNAKQRCNNPKDPSYAAYGGAGVKVLIKSVEELLCKIGLPKEGQTLDRINPNGHYELGNLRWANAAVQAVKKKQWSGNKNLSQSWMAATAKEAAALRATRKHAALGWVRTLRAYNLGHMLEDHAIWMAKNVRCPGVLEANFDFDTVHDMANPSPGYIHLPALSLPNARIRLRCEPPFQFPIAKQVVDHGRLGGLEMLSPLWNVPPALWARISKSVKDRAAGIVLFGQPAPGDLLGGWIEGCCLAMASGITAEVNCTAACFPVHRVYRMLGDLGPSETWSATYHSLLDVDALLIPDLVLDCGPWGEGIDFKWWQLGELLRHRYESGLTSVVGVQNVGKLPVPVRQILLEAYEYVPMPPTQPHACDAMTFAAESWGVPSGSLSLKTIREQPALSSLVEHSGLVGT